MVAVLHPPWIMLILAMWVPTSEDEQAVSMLTLGPLKLYK